MAEYVCPDDLEKNEQMRKLFIGNIPGEATDDEVKAIFEPFGQIEKWEVVRKDGEKKVFAFCTFSKCEMADECLKKRPLKIKDRELKYKRAVAKNDTTETAHMRTKKIFFANCTTETTEDMVREYLEKRHPPKYGKILEIKLVKKKEGEKELSKGYGFIQCENEDLADRISIGDHKCVIDPKVPGKQQEFKKAWEKENGGQAGGRGGRGGRGARGGGRGGFPAQQRGGGYAAGGYGGGYGGYGSYGGYGAQAGGYGGYGAGAGYGYGGGYDQSRPYGW